MKVKRRKRGVRRQRRQRFVGISLGILLVGGAVAYFLFHSNLNAEDYFHNAVSLAEQGDDLGAVIELKNALKKDPEHLESRWLLSEIYLRQKEGALAEKEIEQSKVLGRRGLETRIRLLRALLLQNRFEETLGNLLAHDDVDQNPELLTIRARANLGRGKVERTRKDLEKALELNPTLAEAGQYLARVAMHQDDSEQATTLIDHTLGQNADDLEAWVLKGEIEFAKGNYEEARKAYEEALDISGDHLLGRSGIALTLLSLGEPKAAMEHIDFLETANPNNPIIQYYRALASLQEHDPDAMGASLLDVLSALPHHAPSLC